jgi:hypothetical protein
MLLFYDKLYHLYGKFMNLFYIFMSLYNFYKEVSQGIF